jgi:hypothetical protein
LNTVRHHLRLGTWLALVAMLALALLPTVSHALARSGSGFAEVCTPQGMKVVALADGEQQPSSAAMHLEHCPYCAVAGTAAALPPAPLVLPLPPAEAALQPPLFLQAPSTLFAWAAAQPRGPPSEV